MFKRPVGMYAKDYDFICALLPQYPFMASASTSIKPPLVTDIDDHCSARLRTGWRMWVFPTERARDKFVVQYGGIPE